MTSQIDPRKQVEKAQKMAPNKEARTGDDKAPVSICANQASETSYAAGHTVHSTLTGGGAPRLTVVHANARAVPSSSRRPRKRLSQLPARFRRDGNDGVGASWVAKVRKQRCG